jgi:hypothetical protein
VQRAPVRMPTCFAKNVQLVDVHGKRRRKILGNFFVIPSIVSSNDHLVAAVLWRNALVASMERVWMHRMTVVLIPDGEDRTIVSMQVTPVQP